MCLTILQVISAEGSSYVPKPLTGEATPKYQPRAFQYLLLLFLFMRGEPGEYGAVPTRTDSCRIRNTIPEHAGPCVGQRGELVGEDQWRSKLSMA